MRQSTTVSWNGCGVLSMCKVTFKNHAAPQAHSALTPYMLAQKILAITNLKIQSSLPVPPSTTTRSVSSDPTALLEVSVG